MAPTQTKPTTAQPSPSLARVAGLFGALEAISRLLAVRFILLLSIGGALTLGLQVHDWLGLAVLGIYAGLIVLPLIWLDNTTRRS